MAKVAPLYADRAGGYTRIVKLDKRRVGDQTDLCILQLVGKEEGPQVSGRRSNRRRSADKRTAYAAEMRKKAAEAPKAE
jgi:large subunit ribosomal protein L17